MEEQFLRLLIRQNEVEAQRLLKQKKQQQIQKLLEKSGVGRRFQERTFNTFQPDKDKQEAYQISLEFAQNFDRQTRGILFFGEVGRGKTHLAAAIANSLIAELYTVMFGNITNIISLIRATYNRDSQLTEGEILNVLTKADLLVLDDLGKENHSDNTISLIYQLVNRRYEDNRLLVATSNLTSEELSRKFGPATFSRLVEMCRPIKLVGQDWRLKTWG